MSHYESVPLVEFKEVRIVNRDKKQAPITLKFDEEFAKTHKHAYTLKEGSYNQM